MFRTWKSKQQQINTARTKDKIENFWSSIWEKEKETSFKKETPWIKTLENGYCKTGNDHIRCYWIKRLTSTHPYLLTELKNIYGEEIMLPDWLATGKPILLPKNALTHETKNYRPIACPNITYKIYTGIINNSLENHCFINDIITLEQAGGKKKAVGVVQTSR